MDRLNKTFLAVLAVVALASAGLFVHAVQGQRAALDDAQTVQDLEEIRSAIAVYTSANYSLPSSLSSLSLEPDVMDRLAGYMYTPGEDGMYELCATFRTDTLGGASDNINQHARDRFHKHAKGTYCFEEQSANATFSNRHDPFGFDDSSASPRSMTGTANDTKILSDINVMDAHIQVYYADTGYYPSFDQLNDSSWREVNMRGLTDSHLQGPNGETLGDGYDYEPTPTGCTTNCTGYTLSATYSDGSMVMRSARH